MFETGVWSGQLGVADDTNTAIQSESSAPKQTRPTTVDVISGGPSQWLVGFNGEVVTITKVKGGTSTLKGTLNEGQRATIRDWRRMGADLVIRANGINTETGYADVEVTFEPPI